MTAQRTKTASALTDQGGYTLPELMVAITIGLITAAAGMALLTMAVKSQPRISERAGQIQQGRTMIERVVRELRQGRGVENASADGLTILTYVNSATCGGAAASTKILCRVDYACTATACSRTERDVDGITAGTTTEVVGGLGAHEFTYTQSVDSGHPDYIGVRLAFPGDDGGETVTLEDGVAMRNEYPAQ